MGSGYSLYSYLLVEANAETCEHDLALHGREEAVVESHEALVRGHRAHGAEDALVFGLTRVLVAWVVLRARSLPWTMRRTLEVSKGSVISLMEAASDAQSTLLSM